MITRHGLGEREAKRECHAARIVRGDGDFTFQHGHDTACDREVVAIGDNPAAANVALAVGIDNVRAELLPENKVTAVEELSCVTALSA